jgi:dolichyl-diphosphooligosaccharide--protein glycosyltransferase
MTAADVPTAIANGGSVFRVQTEDWSQAMQWISANTEEDAVIAAWWDYGYWITTLGERSTIADNATINSTRIEAIAKMFIGDQEAGAQIARDLDVDYVLVYVVAQKTLTGTAGDESGAEVPLFTLGQGGEESKKHWIMRIAGYDETRYIESDGFSAKSTFWQSTLLGKLMPYEPLNYVLFSPEGSIVNVNESYQQGFVQLYSKNVKYPAGDPSLPFNLVYSSSSYEEAADIVTGIHIYKVNRDYVPSLRGDPYTPTTGALADTTPGPQIAEMVTAQGTIKIEFFPGAAPRHVDNFVTLAESGFFDGLVFHRLASLGQGFVIQSGDPQTRSATADRSTWGTGGPGYTVSQEFNDISHVQGIVSMARASDPNSAGSQFFIVVDDTPFLDNQYTVFGRVIEGMDVVDRIAQLPTVGGTGPDREQPANPDDARIISVRIVER